MSAFLGEIHNWVYQKIKIQNKLVDEILLMIKQEKNTDDIVKQMDNKFGRLEEGDLKDIVDDKNIHGWLQQRVSLVENRLAFLVSALAEKYPKKISEIWNIAFQVGKQYSLPAGESVKEAYVYLDNLLLNGMPCDRVNKIEIETEEKLVWIQTVDIHEIYWSEQHGNIDEFYKIREQFIAGVLENSGITFTTIGIQQYELRMEG